MKTIKKWLWALVTTLGCVAPMPGFCAEDVQYAAPAPALLAPGLQNPAPLPAPPAVSMQYGLPMPGPIVGGMQNSSGKPWQTILKQKYT